MYDEQPQKHSTAQRSAAAHLEDTGHLSEAEALVEVCPPTALEQVADGLRPLRVERRSLPLVHDAVVEVRSFQAW